MSQDQERDAKFYERADAHIALANEQINTMQTSPVQANDALLYGAARFSTWIVAASFTDAEAFSNDRENAIDYFTNKFREMLDEHFNDYAQNYDAYMGPSQTEQ